MLQKQHRWEAPDRNFSGHRDIVTRSLARYHFVAPHIHGATLDIGCGRGYGFEVIQRRNGAEVGLDLFETQELSNAHTLVALCRP